ncbi:MAG: ABC transporter substrate-binding protein [Alphaproteobacteria bacterium]|nr:ABC transporter substrate-binding protein [Alphaproteobacteria bacterium]
MKFQITKKNLLVAIVIILCMGVIRLTSAFVSENGSLANKTEQSNKTIVAITQIAPHPSLDTIRRGLMDALEKGAIPNLEIIFQNAQGSIATASQIAQKFVSLSPRVIVPITTPSTQSAYAATRGQGKDRTIPVIFAAVSDPIAAKLIPTIQSSGDGITGVYDMAPVEEQARLMQELLPKQARPLSIGIIFNPGEANSVSLVTLMTDCLKQRDITIVKATASTTTEVVAATQSLIGRVDAIYLPNDNTVISALESVLKVTKEHKVPVFASDPESVERGCLAAIAPDQYEIGKQTGEMVVALITGTRLEKLPPERARHTTFVLNLKVAHDIGLIIPDDMIKKATRIVQ